jgi:O-antigen/teichoic acid export membrane protein
MKLTNEITLNNGINFIRKFFGAPNSLTRYAGLLAISQYVGAVIGFLTNIFAARILGPIEFGSAALILTYPMLLWSFLSFKPVTVTIRYIAGLRASGKRSELISICKVGYTLDLLTSTAVSILILTTSWWVADHIYKLPDVSWLIVIYGVSLPFFSLIGTSHAILSSWQYFHWLSIFQIMEKLITLFLVLGFLSFGLGIPGMIIAIAIGHSINGIIMLITATRLLYLDGYGFWWKGSFSITTSLRKELISFFSWNYFFVTLVGVVGQVPIILLGRIRGPEEAGFYRLATSLMTAGSYLEGSLRRVVYPNLSARWAKGEINSIRDSLKRWTLKGGLPVGILLILVTSLLPIFIPMVFGPSYSPMVTGAQIMMLGAAGSAVFFWLNSFYYASGRIVQWAKAYSLYTFLVIGLGWFCINQWGFVGMAAVIAVGKILFTSSMVILLVWSHGTFHELLLGSRSDSTRGT